MVKPPPPPPPRPEGGPEGRFQKADPRWSRLLLWLAMFAVLAVFVFPTFNSTPDGDEIAFDTFLSQVRGGEIAQAEINNVNGEIEGHFKATEQELTTDAEALGEPFTSKGPLELTDSDRRILASDPDLDLTFTTPTGSFWGNMIPLLLPIGLLIAFFWWMQRRAQGQIGGIMSIGRSKAKTYTTERPGTTFEDVAGYAGVKQEITRGCRVPETAREIQRDRRPYSQGHAACWSPGYR